MSGDGNPRRCEEDEYMNLSRRDLLTLSGLVLAGTALAPSGLQGFDTLPLQAQMVIIDMVFNLGVGGFSTFRKMIAAVERRDWTAAKEMRDSIWYHQVGRRADQDIALIASCAVPPPAPGGSGGSPSSDARAAASSRLGVIPGPQSRPGLSGDQRPSDTRISCRRDAPGVCCPSSGRSRCPSTFRRTCR